MSRRFFGTDGIRGSFGVPPLDEATVRRLGRALGRQLAAKGGEPHVVLGGDTRDSTPVLARWLADGLTPARITWMDTVPTPAVAWAVRELGASCGVAVSASHNPHPDNGIKLVGADGFKWPIEAEAALEEILAAEDVPDDSTVELEVDRTAVDGYLRSLRASVSPPYSPRGDSVAADSEAPLAGLSVALDMGNGAASAYAEEVFAVLGAHVTLVHAAPNGCNINDGCGSTHPAVIAALTRETGSDLGFSFDGDADRVILADENGEVRDGDAVLYLWARDLAERDALPGRRLVATSMSNLGLEVALAASGIELVRCDVGDRHVVTTLREQGLVLGGEQSGHIVHLGLGTTGDGLLTALQIAHLCQRAGRPRSPRGDQGGKTLSELLVGFERFPQLIQNVRVREKVPFEELPAVGACRDRIAAELGAEGRLVLRYSGTEPLARIMIEGREQARIEALATDLAGVIESEVGES